jgi:hypothetical protein
MQKIGPAFSVSSCEQYCAGNLAPLKISLSQTLRRLGLNPTEKLYCFLKALLPIPKRRIPTPRRSRVTGQGKGQPKNGLGMPANINIESIISNAPAIIKSHFDAVNIVLLLFVIITYLSNA